MSHMSIKILIFLFIGGGETSSMTKRIKQQQRSSSGRFAITEPPQYIHANDNSLIPEVPVAFLSSSVREYLELGRSIPGI